MLPPQHVRQTHMQFLLVQSCYECHTVGFCGSIVGQTYREALSALTVLLFAAPHGDYRGLLASVEKINAPFYKRIEYLLPAISRHYVAAKSVMCAVLC